MGEQEDLLKDFIEFLKEHPNSVYYAFDDTDEAIDEFLSQHDTD
jgi:hypothetical protein